MGSLHDVLIGGNGIEFCHRRQGVGLTVELKETTGGEFRVYRASTRLL